ncbi:hypothetical protein FRUB_00416 [Fimbriiglobus ruber]|uniref:Serine aminopeptidase S33 domain-containing protein n=1 Tax=Fimbriiglobus ruber TaxID=1908690 RepID=A0A225EEJ8_9BACT|nr:hypothetical protein FRUB_00416 [Fimbriiglobus ruber]
MVLTVSFLGLNLLAYQHARAMLTFQGEAERTPSPQSLTFGQKVNVLARGVTIPRPKNMRSPQDLGLVSETVRYSTADGLNLEGCLIVPPRPRGTVILFHGYTASRATLLEQGQFFHEQGFATLLVDFRGSGGSDGSTTSLGYHEAQDVDASVRYARSRELPGPLILYGFSMGGTAILRSIAALDTRPDAVILESVFARMLGAVRNRFDLMGVPSFPAAELMLFWGGVQVGFSGFDHNPVEYSSACRCAALVLHGAEDRNAKPEEGRAIYEHLTGSKEMVVFAGAGHTSLYAADPKQWTTVVSQFLVKQTEGVTQPGP